MADEYTLYDRENDKLRQVKLVPNDDGSYSVSMRNQPGYNLDVLVGDQATDSMDIHFVIVNAENLTLSVAAAKNDRQITLTAGHGFVIGSYITLIKPAHYYRGIVTAVNTNLITLDTPICSNFGIAETEVKRGTRNLIPNASGGGPVIAKIFVPEFQGETLDITRIMMQMTTTNPTPWNSYGDRSILVNGLVLRVVYDVGLPTERIVNLWNVKSNAEYGLHSYDIQFIEQTGPQAVNGVACRSSWAGQDKRGVVIRLTYKDELQVLLQDNFSTILSQYIMAEGHLVLE